MPSLWFVMPAHGRAKLAKICMTQLRRTCDELADHCIRASAVVVADDANLETARELGFAVVERGNRFVSRKFNDGIQLAMDDRYNPFPADYVVPIGSDDWVDWRLFRRLPRQDTVVGFQAISFVREDGRQITGRFLNYQGGCGIRIYPRNVMQVLGFRPCDEDRARGCDTSMLVNLTKVARFQIEHRRSNPRQIVDWKSPGENLNRSDDLAKHKRMFVSDDPYAELADIYPADALEEMRNHYATLPRRSLVLA